MLFTIDKSKFSYAKAYELFENVLWDKKLIKRYEIK